MKCLSAQLTFKPWFYLFKFWGNITLLLHIVQVRYWKACPSTNTKHKSKEEALGKSVSINFLLYEGHSDIISLYMYLKNNCAATKPNLGYIYSKNSHSRPPILCRSLNHCPSLTWSVPSLRFSSPASHRPSLPAFPLPPDDLLSHLPSYSSLVLVFLKSN